MKLSSDPLFMRHTLAYNLTSKHCINSICTKLAILTLQNNDKKTIVGGTVEAVKVIMAKVNWLGTRTVAAWHCSNNFCIHLINFVNLQWLCYYDSI